MQMSILIPISSHNGHFYFYLLLTTLYVYSVVRRNRKDRVLLCEALGVGIFLAALFLGGLIGLPDWLIVVSGLIAVFFAVLALYFGLLNWAQRRVRSDRAK